ncbi:MAG: protein kinase domain-containing protein [Solirubrobacteraceae bacterium]
MSTPVGTLLSGRYLLEEQVGIGGMSRVYRALDTLLERHVAIKTLNREIASDSDQLERFRREARAVAQLSHPHIVRVIDAGEDSGTAYIVFEYVGGETLKAQIRRLGRLEIPAALAYAIEIARALSCAHDREIVHRDVKPQNVLIDPEGSAKITDFGIARTLTEEGLTADGRVLGTTDYVSPEQAMGQPVTGQSDLYSLGIVLYEMLCGEVPFAAGNQVAVAMKHVREEIPDVQERRPEISAALASVVDRATEKDVRRRYPDAGAMIADLEEVLAIETARSGAATGEVTSVLRTLPSSARRRLPLRLRSPSRVVASLAALAVLAAGAIVLLATNTHRGTGVPPTISAPPAEQPVSLAADSAHDYDPYGDKIEHPEQTQFVVDSDPNSAWNTETYQNGNLAKPGVGIYLDASPGVSARSIVIETPTPGFSAQIFVYKAKPSASPPAAGLGQPLASVRFVHRRESIPLDTAGDTFRYYLVWITKLPANADRAAISTLALFK